MGAELDLSFDFGLAFGKLDDSLKDLRKPDPKPLFIDYKSSGVGNGSINIGTPPAGMIWNILSLTILGDGDDHTAVTGSAALYVDADAANLTVSQCKMPGLSIPFFQFISRGTLWAHASGDVALNVSGTSGSPEIIGIITVAAWHEKDIASRYA